MKDREKYLNLLEELYEIDRQISNLQEDRKDKLEQLKDVVEEDWD